MASQSRLSSMRSAMVPPPLFGGYGIVLAVQRSLERVPGERGALDACGKARHACECAELSQVRGVFLAVFAAHHPMEAAEDLVGLGGGLSLQCLGHHGPGGARYGASSGLERNVLDAIAVHGDVDLALVAAQRVEAFGLLRSAFKDAEVPRRLGVLQDHFLVDVLEFRHQPRISFTFSMPRTSASISS